LELRIEELRSSINVANKTREEEKQQLEERLCLMDQARAALEKKFDKFRNNAADTQRFLSSLLNNLCLGAANKHDQEQQALLMPADVKEELLKRGGIDLGSQFPDIPATLRWAAANGHGEAAALLIQRGWARHTADSDGVTALHLAARGGHTAMVQQLLAAGAPIEARQQRIDNSTDRTQGTPLHWAAIEGHIGPMIALLDAHAEIDARNRWYRTPLHCAARFGHLPAVQLLAKRGADKEARRDTNETPLHFAIEEDKPEVVTYLLDVGADINAWGNRGTPLQYAQTRGRPEIAQYLESRGAKSEASTPVGQYGRRFHNNRRMTISDI
jgi:ankyrin repeat protein